MRWLTLYLRSRRVPLALGALTGVLAVTWALWLIFSDDRQVGAPMVVLTVLLLVSAAGMTLAGPDDALERTAARRWQPRRLVHLLAAFAMVAGLVVLTQLTGARFGPVAVVLRDAAGLLGLTALGAATLGTARAWIAPLGWTLIAVVLPLESALGQVVTWQVQPPDNTRAAVTAGVLAVAGLAAYALRGPAPKAPAEAAL